MENEDIFTSQTWEPYSLTGDSPPYVPSSTQQVGSISLEQFSSDVRHLDSREAEKAWARFDRELAESRARRG
jgi:hypothetical protein